MATVYLYESYNDTYVPSNTVSALSTQTWLAFWNTKLNAGAKLESTVGNGTVRSSFLAPDYSSLTVTTSGGTVIYKNLKVFADKSFTMTGYTVTSSDGASSWEVIGNLTVSPTYVVSGTMTSAKYSSSINTASPETWMFQGSVTQNGTQVQGSVDKYIHTYKYLGYLGTDNYSLSSAFAGVDYVNGGVILSPSTLVTGYNANEVDANGRIVYQVRVDGMPTVTANTVNLWGLILAGDDTLILSGGGNQIAYSGQGGNDTFIGDAGNNYFNEQVDSSGGTRGVGNDAIDGGAGYDYVLYGSNKSIGVYGFFGFDSLTNSITLADYSAANNSGVDRLTNIEEIQFSDKNLTWSEITSLISSAAKLGSAFGVMRYGGAVAETIGCTDKSDLVFGNAGNDTVAAGAGNDTVFGGLGNDSIDGGVGIDVLQFQGKLSEYKVLVNAGAGTVADKILSRDGTDQITSIEHLRFSDFDVNTSVKGLASSISTAAVQRLSELYVAFFNRVPDSDGLYYWLSQFKSGTTVNQIAESFYNAGVQYTSLTGFSSTMTSTDFINVVYRNVLGRTEGADTGGLKYWTDQLATGVETRGSLVSTILGTAHSFKGDTTWGWVANLLDNKVSVANKVAIDWGLNYLTADLSITNGMAIAKAVTPTDISAAIALVGLTEGALSII